MQFFRTQILFEGSAKSRTWRLPLALFSVWRWGRRIVCLGLILLILQTALFFGYEYFLRNALSQRESLQAKLSQLYLETDSLNQRMDSYFASEDLLYAKAGLQPLDHSVRALGTGGEILPEERFKRFISPSVALSADVQESSERLLNKIEKNQNAFKTLGNFMERQRENWRFIPSISPASGRYASAFGRRTHPVTGELGKMHYGIDISNVPWTPIYASADGVVQIAQKSSSFGNYVVLNHGNGIVTKYGHMQRYIVQPGQFVNRYQIIGYMGNTGRSVGPHLHYEVWRDGNAVNPLAYILPNEHAIE